MPVLLAILGLFAPRFVIIMLWLFTNWFQGVFETKIWPILGFFFLPLTTLWYGAVMNWYGGAWDAWKVVVLIIAVLLDMGTGHNASKRERSA